MNADMAFVGFDECTGDGESDAASSVCPVACGVDAVEAVKNVVEVLRCDAFSSVGDSDLHVPMGLL